jgi:hypothetical protein
MILLQLLEIGHFAVMWQSNAVGLPLRKAHIAY